MSEVGIIGQMYENRKSKKIGVLESRDEKFKTLLFRGDDGSSFNVNYSTFKSNWRKYEGDKLIQTSSQVEDAKEEAAAEEAAAEQVVKKATRSTKKVDKTEEFKVIEALRKKVDAFAVDGLKVKTGAKGCVAVYLKNVKQLEIWVKLKTHTFEFAIRQEFYEDAGLTFTADIALKDAWVLKYSVKGIDLDYLDDTVKYVMDKLNEYYAAQTAEDSNDSEAEEEE